MSTKKRRMMLSLPAELEHAFDEFREATGTAPASFVVQMLMESLPVIQAITAATKTAKTDSREAANIMQQVMTSALHQGTAAQLDLYAQTNTIRKARTPRKVKP